MANKSLDRKNTAIVVNGAGILFVGSMIGFALRYLINIVATRGVNANEYGIFSLGTSWVTIISTLAVLGMDIGVVRFVSIFRGINDTSKIKGTLLNSLVIVLLTGLILSILAYITAPSLSQKIYGEPGLLPLLHIFAVSVPFYAVTMVMLAGTQGFLRMQYSVYVNNLLVPIGRLVLSLVFLTAGLNAKGLAWAFVIPIIFGAFGSLFFLNKTYSLFDRSTPSTRVSRELIKFSTPLLALSMLQVVGGQSEVLLLGLFTRVANVGIYSAALTTALIATIILGAFDGIFSPIVSDLYQRRLMVQLKQTYCLTTRWGLSLTLPIILVMFLFPKLLLNILGPVFSDAYMVLVILALGQLFHTTIGSTGTMLTMTGSSGISLGVSFFRFVIVIILDLIFIPRYNLLGAAVASTCALTISDFVKLVIVYKQFRIHPFALNMFKPLIAAGLTVVIIYGMKPVYDSYLSGFKLLVIGTLAIFLLYGGMVFLFRFDSEDHIVLDIMRHWFFYKKEVNS